MTVRPAETARSAARKRVLVSGLAPALLLLFPLEVAIWDWRRVLLHAGYQFVAGALLVELMFWSFDRVPFTCSYFPGKMNLSLLAVIYLYGFTNYSFHMSDLELALESRLLLALLFLVVSAAILAWCWRRRGVDSAVSFDTEEPLIQTLDLT